VPAGPLLEQHFLPLRREPVIAPATLAALLNPFAVDPSATLHAIEHRIERCDVEPEDATGAVVDEFRDFVAVPCPLFEHGQDHEISAAALQFGMRRHIWPHTISDPPRDAAEQFDGVKGDAFADLIDVAGSVPEFEDAQFIHRRIVSLVWVEGNPVQDFW
jgi:hypothetical protein